MQFRHSISFGIIIIIIIIIFIITFIQNIYNYIPGTNHVSKVYNVVSILWLQCIVMLFPMTNILYIYISTLWNMCTMPHMAVFCSPLISCFPDKSLRYLMNDVEMVPVAPVITVITYGFTFYIQCISIAMSLCIVTSLRFISWSHFYVLKLQCLLTDMFLICCHTLWCPLYCEGWLSVFTCWSTLISWLVSTNFGTYLYQCSLTNLTPVPCTC